METAIAKETTPADAPEIRPGLGARWAVGIEFLRALAGLCFVPFSAVAYLMRRKHLALEVVCDLEERAKLAEIDDLQVPMDRPLKIFISAAEASGEIHATSLVRSL